MTVLALDLATTCGFAILRADGRIESGVESFAPKTKDREGARWVRFHGWLVDLKQAHSDIDLIAYELVVGGVPGQVFAAQIYGGFLALTQRFAEHHGIEYRGHHVGTIKKAWTGNGAAKKDAMIARCIELGFKPADDNEADAIALLHVATNRVPALPLDRQVKKPRPRPNPDTRTRPMMLQSAEDPF